MMGKSATSLSRFVKARSAPSSKGRVTSYVPPSRSPSNYSRGKTMRRTVTKTPYTGPQPTSIYGHPVGQSSGGGSKTLGSIPTKTPYTGYMQNTIYGTPVTPMRSYGNGMMQPTGGGSSGGGYGGGGYSRGGSSGGGGGAAVGTPVSPPVTTPPPPTTAPPVTPPTTAPPAPSPTTGSWTSRGRGGTYGQWQRMRNARGPMTGLSMTPEMIRRIAAQRFTRQF